MQSFEQSLLRWGFEYRIPFGTIVGEGFGTIGEGERILNYIKVVDCPHHRFQRTTIQLAVYPIAREGWQITKIIECRHCLREIRRFTQHIDLGGGYGRGSLFVFLMEHGLA
jgi:hypothetical protein